MKMKICKTKFCNNENDSKFKTCKMCREIGRENALIYRKSVKHRIEQIAIEYKHEEGCQKILQLLEDNRYGS
jgi:hypothetical protein